MKAICQPVDGRCTQCGCLVELRIRRTCHAWIATAPPQLQPNRGLGDYTERLLASIGVTKDRYVAAKKLFGLAPTCGCAERQAWLNRVGKWLGL